MRLIDADWVLGHLKPYEQSDEEWGVTGGTALRLIHNAVDRAPTVDAVVVTRCKDCRNHRELNRKDRLESGYAEGVLWCMNRSDGVWADGFCSDGEPKEDTC